MDTPRPGFQILHITLPLLTGGVIYLLFRPDTLLMFQWAEFFQIRTSISSVRVAVHQSGLILPEWVIYSLPDALWSYSLLYFIGSQWIMKNSWGAYVWFSLGIAMSIGSEVGQFAGWIPGTFDFKDLILKLVFIAFASYSIPINYIKSIK